MRTPSARGRWIPWALVAAGVALRVARFRIDNSLEVAESELALNLMHRSFTGLLAPLDYDQGAPLGFLWIVKAIVTALGPGESALRLFPFACSIASVFLFKALAQRCLDRFGANLALALFACSPMLLWYSSQVKQYSVDVAIGCGLLLLAHKVASDGITWRSALALALAGVVAIPLSHPAVFFLAGTGCALEIARLRIDRRALAMLACVAAVWCGSFAAFYFVFLRNLEHNDYLLRYWSANLMPFPPTTFADLRWFPTTFFGMFTDPAGFELATGLAAFLFLIGLVEILRRDRTLLTILCLPILVTLVASAAHQYPFGRRLILFVVPILLIGIGAGAAEIARLARGAAPWIAPLLAAMLLFDPALGAIHSAATGKRHEDLRAAVAYLTDHWQAGDTLYLYSDAQYAYRYYAERRGVSFTPLVVGTSSESHWDEDLDDIDRLGGRTWLLFSHIHQEGGAAAEDRYFAVHLDRRGKRLDTFHADGVVLHLYDLPR